MIIYSQDGSRFKLARNRLTQIAADDFPYRYVSLTDLKRKKTVTCYEGYGRHIDGMYSICRTPEAFFIGCKMFRGENRKILLTAIKAAK